MLNKKGQDNLVMKLEGIERKIFDVQQANIIPMITLVLVLVALVLLLIMFYKFYMFVDKNRIIIQNPIRVEVLPVVIIQSRDIDVIDVEAVVLSPVPATQEAKIPVVKETDKGSLVKNSKFPKFISHIWNHESGNGTNSNPRALHNYCKSKGMTNEFGFYPQGKWCWETFEEGIARLEKWRTHEAKGLSDNAALCYYNEGIKSENCAYLGNNFALMN